MATQVIWIRRITKATIMRETGEHIEVEAGPGNHIFLPVLNGGVLSIEYYNTQTNELMKAEFFAGGTWLRVDIQTSMVKLEVEEQQPGQPQAKPITSH